MKKLIKPLLLLSIISLVGCDTSNSGGNKADVIIDDSIFANYAISYDNNVYHEKSFSEQLQNYLKANEIKLDIKKQSELSANDKKILIAQFDSSTTLNKYEISSDGSSIYLKSNSTVGFSEGLNILASSLLKIAKEESTIEQEFATSKTGIAKEATAKVMSFNLRVGDDYGECSLSKRLTRQVDFINKVLPDTVGTQECIYSMVDYLGANLKDHYDYIGEVSDNVNGEMVPIFYNKDKVELIDSGTRWYSDRPELAGSLSPISSNYLRIYTFGLFKHKQSGKYFVHINTHLDLDLASPYKAQDARMLESRLLADFADKYEGIPRFITADYNCQEVKGDGVYYLENNRGYVRSSELASVSKSTIKTFPWANYTTTASSLYKYTSDANIDFVLCGGDKSLVDTYEVYDDVSMDKLEINGILSDHYPISSDIVFINPLVSEEKEFDFAKYEKTRFDTQLNGEYTSKFENNYLFEAANGHHSGVNTQVSAKAPYGAAESLSDTGEYHKYVFDSPEKGLADIEYVLASSNYANSKNNETKHIGSYFQIEVNGKKANIDSYTLPVNSDTDWYNWQKIYIKDVMLNKGTNNVKFTINNNIGANLSHIVVHTNEDLSGSKPIVDGDNLSLVEENGSVFAKLHMPNKNIDPNRVDLILENSWNVVDEIKRAKTDSGIDIKVNLKTLPLDTNLYSKVRIDNVPFDNLKGDLVGSTTHTDGSITQTLVSGNRTYTLRWKYNIACILIKEEAAGRVKVNNIHIDDDIRARYGLIDSSEFKDLSCVTPSNALFVMGNEESNRRRFYKAHLEKLSLPIYAIRSNTSSNSCKLVVFNYTTKKITKLVALTMSKEQSSKYTVSAGTISGSTAYKVFDWIDFDLDLTLVENEAVAISVTASDTLFFGYKSLLGERPSLADTPLYGLTSFDQSSNGISVGASLGVLGTGNSAKIAMVYDFYGDFNLTSNDYYQRNQYELLKKTRLNKSQQLKQILAGKKLSAFGDSISSNVDYCNNTSVNTKLAGNYVAYNNNDGGIYSSRQMWWNQVALDIGADVLVANGFSGDWLAGTSTSTLCRGLDRCVELHNNVVNPNIMPDIIVVYFGVNDLAYHETLTGTFLKLYDQMIEKMTTKYPKATIFYSTIGATTKELNKSYSIEEHYCFNETIRLLVDKYQKLGKDVNLVDMYNDSGITETNINLYTNDALHPNQDGMRLFADTFIDAMIKRFVK